MNDLVSIIVPVYNVESYLDKCISSLVAQEYGNIEIILIDDGSSDKSGAICDKWAQEDNRIKIVHKKNEGVSSARNDGINLASGKYFIFVDSDDYIKTNHVKNLVETRLKYPNAGHIWCCFEMILDNNKAINVFLADKNLKYSVYDRSNVRTLYSKSLGGSPWLILYNREVVLKNKIKMDNTISFGEDTLFNYEYLNCIENTTIVIRNEATYCYRYQGNGTLDTKYSDNMLKVYNDNTRREIIYLQKWNLSEQEWNVFWNTKFYLYEKALRNTFRKENKRSFIKKLKYNSNFMKSEIYKNTCNHFTAYMNPVLKNAYKSNSYIWVWMLQKICNLKNKFLRGIYYD